MVRASELTNYVKTDPYSSPRILLKVLAREKIDMFRLFRNFETITVIDEKRLEQNKLRTERVFEVMSNESILIG